MNLPLPARDGVSPSCVALPVGPWRTVLEFLTARFPDVHLTTWLLRMEKGEVADESGARLSPNSAYRSHGKIYYYREIDSEVRIPFDEAVLYQDEHILVVDKPHFLPVIPSGIYLQETLLVRLKRKLHLNYLVPIHRIDRDTAGVVLFSVKPHTRGAYQSLFQRREVGKAYHAVAGWRSGDTFPLTYRSRMVEGEPFFLMKEADGEPNSETVVDLLEHRSDCALYRLTPVTGRKHQLRLHMASLGRPIVNDAFYPRLVPRRESDFATPLQLIAKSIEFLDPVTGAHRRFESPRTL